MEGFSVTEAASVLGVPTERIWELLARGVLAGAPEGETGMRVFLQPRPAPPAPEPRGPNGHGADPEREMSPFRELLTEFRNLTERYGQALLALGESRGEVAALRSRVDLLEARMDLRLPGGSSWAPSPAFPTEHAVIPTVPEPSSDAPQPTPEAELAEERREEEIRRRSRGPRRATESFAEALARAQDPSPPELPESLEARARDLDDAMLPRSVPAAEAVPVADEGDQVELEAGDIVEDEPAAIELEPEPVAVAEEEPPAPADPITASVADEVPFAMEEEVPKFEEVDSATVDDAPVEMWVEAEVTEPSEPDETEAAPEPEPAEPAEGEGGAPPRDAADAEDAVTRASIADAPPDGLSVDEPASSEAEPTQDVEAEGAVEEPAPLDWDAERYTTTIDEPDWFEADIDEPRETSPETPVMEAAVEDAGTGAAAEPAQGSADLQHPTPEHTGPDEIEAPPSIERRAETSIVPPGATPLPGSAELDRALDALRRRAIEADESDEWPPSAVADGPAAPTEMVMPPYRPSTPSRTGTPPVTPAGRAYRRLRRIFPG